MVQKVSVMYGGVVVESTDVKTLFTNPLHPYTHGLLTSIPRPDRITGKKTRLNTIAGVVPSLLDLPIGCRFSDRCPEVHEPCMKWEPTLAFPEDSKGEKSHLVRCWLHLPHPEES